MSDVATPDVREIALSDLDYEYDPQQIALHPPERRDGGRLLLLPRHGASPIAHQRIESLPDLTRPALWVVNDTKVVNARLLGKRASGGKVELLLLEPLGDAAEYQCRYRALGRANRPLKAGAELVFGDGEVQVVVEGRDERGILTVQVSAKEAPGGLESAIDRVGQVPLPPYIRRAPETPDRDRYQTIFAGPKGAAAAPTAGLHFTTSLVTQLEERGHRFCEVTLHVGPGTFRPVTVERLSDHPMHEERFEVPKATADAIAAAKSEGMPVIAVGTTVVRTLEAAARADGSVAVGKNRTDLFITPPFSFRVVDGLMTNFHLPRSTLLALVMAFGGIDPVKRAYQAAVEERYRLFSYGDAMLIAPLS